MYPHCRKEYLLYHLIRKKVLLLLLPINQNEIFLVKVMAVSLLVLKPAFIIQPECAKHYTQ
jgi:hypothetical protein